ncbi:MAG: hypothetical protein ACREJQ_07510, partial [bacterium]
MPRFLSYLITFGLIAGIVFGVHWVNRASEPEIKRVKDPLPDIPPRLIGSKMQVMDNADPTQI